MDDKEAIEVFYEELEDKKYYTIEEVSKIVKVDEAKIEYYYNKLNSFLDITSVGMFQVYTKEDIDNLKRIKTLDVDKNMSMDEIKKYLKTHTQEIIVKQENKIDVSFLDFLANVLTQQNNKIDTVASQNEKLVELIEKVVISQDSLIENQKFLNEKLNSIESEVAITKDTNDKIDNLRFLMQERKVESESKKGFLSRLLGR